MAKMRIEGSFVAPPTPFNENGAVDHSAYRALLQHLEDNGTVAALIMGSTGEPSLLEPEEKKKIESVLGGLKMVLNSSDRETIQKWTHALNDATQHLAEVMMNRSLQAALSGKNVDEL